MKRLVTAGFLLVIGFELIALAARDRQLVLSVSGAGVVLTLLIWRWYLVRETETAVPSSRSDEAAEVLARWRSRTELLVERADSTRREWDRHLRPMLARQFEMSTGQRRAKDRNAYHATGEMLFGGELWRWVNPENVAAGAADEPGPGRNTLDEILRRLEQV